MLHRSYPQFLLRVPIIRFPRIISKGKSNLVANKLQGRNRHKSDSESLPIQAIWKRSQSIWKYLPIIGSGAVLTNLFCDFLVHSLESESELEIELTFDNHAGLLPLCLD